MHMGCLMEKVTDQLRRRELIDAVVIGEACGVLQAYTHLAHHARAITTAGSRLSKGLPNQNQGLQQTKHQDILSPGQDGQQHFICLQGSCELLSIQLPAHVFAPASSTETILTLSGAPGAPAKIAFLADGAEENSWLPQLSPPHPPKTPANTFCPLP